MRHPAVHRRAATQHGVICRRQLYAMGLTRWAVEAQLRAERWRRHGRQTVAVHTGDLSRGAHWWRAVWEVGGDAALEGVTALIAAGLTGFADDTLRLSVSRGARYRRLRGVRVYETRRRQPGDVLGSGLPRVRPAVAAVRAALWARSNRQAALLWLMTVQQRIVTPAELAEAFATVKRHPRRRFLAAVLGDVTNGVQSMGEFDFARMCRRANLPEPSRQVVRQGPHGRVYLDVYWKRWRAAVEIDGIQHLDVKAAIPEALRQNAVTIAKDGVLRIPVLGLRVEADAFMAQVRAFLASRGWPG